MSISDEVPAIEIMGLRKLYNGFAAVDGLSITVPQRCFFGFLGPNGAGKTTTIKMLMGLAQPDAGSIHVLGFRCPKNPWRSAAKSVWCLTIRSFSIT